MEEKTKNQSVGERIAEKIEQAGGSISFPYDNKKSEGKTTFNSHKKVARIIDLELKNLGNETQPAVERSREQTGLANFEWLRGCYERLKSSHDNMRVALKELSVFKYKPARDIATTALARSEALVSSNESKPTLAERKEKEPDASLSAATTPDSANATTPPAREHLHNETGEVVYFSERRNTTQMVDDWLKTNNVELGTFNVLCALLALGFKITRPTKPVPSVDHDPTHV